MNPTRWLVFLDTDHLSGPARLALDFCVQLQREGHQPLMLGLVRARRPHPTALSEAVEAAGVPCRLLHERFRFDPSILEQFLSILRKDRPDVYQSHGYKGSWLGQRAKAFGIPWQAVFHGFTWENPLVRLYHALDVRWLRHADEVIAVSRPFEQTLLTKGISPARLRWIPNAISEQALVQTDSGEDLRSQWLGADKSSTVLAGVLGRFSPEKGPDLFIRAMALAAQEVPAFKAVMLGDGPMLDACRAAADRLGLSGRVVLPGFRPDLAAVYRALDMLVIPSRSEGMPTVMIEAMLMGVPIVSTRVGGVPDILRDGQTALLTPLSDAEALAKAIVTLASDGALRGRLAQAAHQIARSRLTVEGRTQTILDHAQCLIQGRPLPQTPSWEC